MKKSSLLWLSAVAVSSLVLTSCGGDDTVAPPTTTTKTACDSAVYPSSTGDATVEIENFANTTIAVQSGSDLSLAVAITKGANGRAQKLRLFQSDCPNLIGDEVDLSDQPKGGRNGIDLRRTDDKQIRNVIYSVPASGFSKIYLTIEVDEVNNKMTYKKLTLNVSGSGVIDTWTNVTLGSNTNANPSRMVTGTGETYVSCDAAANIDYIDVTYSNSLTAPYKAYLSSNPARFLAPIGLAASSAPCGEDGTLPTDGGTATHFVIAPSTANFDAATDADLNALAVTTADSQAIEVKAAGDVFAFVNAAGKKGLIKVVSVNQLASTAGSIVVSVKVQR
jgi:hypothetical protein